MMGIVNVIVTRTGIVIKVNFFLYIFMFVVVEVMMLLLFFVVVFIGCIEFLMLFGLFFCDVKLNNGSSRFFFLFFFNDGLLFCVL